MPKWDFVTNHGLVVIHLVQNPRSTLREISDAVGITERAALSILRALEEDGIISRMKEGRRNRYWINFTALLSHRREGRFTIAEIGQYLAAALDRVREADAEERAAARAADETASSNGGRLRAQAP